MKASELNLAQLVRDEITETLGAHHIVKTSSLVQMLMDSRSEPEGEDSDYWVACGWYAMTAIVGNEIRTRKGREKDGDPAQACFPGYERLQTAYTITRDDESCIVPTEQLTDAELMAKADEHRAMSAGHLAHADELIAYAKARAVVAAE